MAEPNPVLGVQLFGRRLVKTKQRLAVFCMALSLVLSAQMTIALLDRLQHDLGIAHAPNALAGMVLASSQHVEHAAPGLSHHSHRHGHAGVPAKAHHHDDGVVHSHGVARHHHDTAGNDDHGTAAPHQHSTLGILAPWLISAPFQLTPVPPLQRLSQYRESAHPDAPFWRRERPPKPHLEIPV